MMESPIFSRRTLLRSLVAVSALSLSGFALANADDSTRRQDIEGLTVILRLPSSGIVAGEEVILSLRLEHSDKDGKSETVPYARVEAAAKLDDTTKPAVFSLFPGGVSGEYSLVGTFADAGNNTMTVTITPSGGKAIVVAFDKITVKPASEKNSKVEPDYTLKLEMVPAQPLPGELVELRLSVLDAQKKRVTDFEQIYDAPFHLYVLREDVNELHHETPELLTDAPGRKDDGVFYQKYTFATGGTWRLIAEVAPKRDGAQILTTKVTIPGARALPEPLMAQVSPIIQQSGITLRFERPVRLVAKEVATLPLRLTDSQGNGLSDLQFANGALAHLYFADKNGNFVHTLPDSSDPRTGRAGSNIIAFPVRFPKGGTYRAWLIFSRGAQSYTIPFVVKVNDK